MDLGDDPAGEIDQHVFRDANGSTVRAHPGRLSALSVTYRFPYENPFCTGILYGRAGRLNALFGGSRPGQYIVWKTDDNSLGKKLTRLCPRPPGALKRP